MTPVVKEISKKETWEDFLKGCDEKTFLQSWNWGEFQILQGNKIWRFGVYENNELIGIALTIKVSARRGKFLFVPHGPVTKNPQFQILSTLLEELKSLAKKEKASFIRVSPIWERNEINNKTFRGLGFRDSPIHMHAEVTWELDITPTEDEILDGMRKTTRYLIRQAQKNQNIQIEKSNNINDLQIFNPIYLETAKRHNFTVFSEDYLRDQFAAFSIDNQIQFFFGKYKGEIVSVAIFVFWQNIAFYHHSGSLLKYSKIPINYLLQWEAIKEAKKRGCKIYNFWGIAPDIKTEGPKGYPAKKSKPRRSCLLATLRGRHPWAGLSLFKMGFGGYRRDLVKTQDFIISKKYWLNYLIEKIRKVKRNL